MLCMWTLTKMNMVDMIPKTSLQAHMSTIITQLCMMMRTMMQSVARISTRSWTHPK